MTVLIDTNVLLRVRDANDPRHSECVAAIDALQSSAHSPFICMQVLAEFWVVSTRPRDMNGMGLNIEAAAQQLAWMSSAFPCLLETLDTASRWMQIVTDRRVVGRQAHDARLVALMLAHGITQLLTLNTPDFTRYPEITPLTPAEVLFL